MSNPKVKELLNQAKQSFAAVKDMIKKEEAAKRLKVSPRTVDRLAERGMLTKFQVLDTTSVRFSAKQIDALFSRAPTPKKPQVKATTFGKFSDDKNAAPIFHHGFKDLIEVTPVVGSTGSCVLSAFGCVDPTVSNGIIKSFKWEKIDGHKFTGFIRNPTAASTDFISLVPGEYKVRLTMTGKTGVSTSREIRVKVNTPAAATVALKKHVPSKSQPIKTTFGIFEDRFGMAPVFPPYFKTYIELSLLHSHVTCELSAAGCVDPMEPSGKLNNYNWEILKGSPAGNINDPKGATAQLGPNLSIGTYKIRLTITGRTGLSAFKDITVNVKSPDPRELPLVGPDPSVEGAKADAGNGMDVLFVEKK